MAPLFMKHSATVLSLHQLVDDDSASPSGGGAGPACGAALAPDACVYQIAGAPLAMYAYAERGPRKIQVQRRSYSEHAHVPSLDDTSSSSVSCSPVRLQGDSDGEDCAACFSERGSSRQQQLQQQEASRDAADQQAVPVTSPDSPLSGDELPDQQKSLLDNALLALWEDCAEQGLFRYDVTECATKLVPGLYGFVAQLNEGRASKKRPTEFRIDQVCQPFDENKFNFKKAYMREVLFQFEPRTDIITSITTTVPAVSEISVDVDDAGGGDAGASCVVNSAPASSSPNLVLINVSPIEYGHVLLCPRVLDCLPQLVDTSTALLALRFAMESDNPYCRVGYNSLGAYATINHLHFQAYYLAVPFPCERAPCALVKGLKRKRGNVRISRMVNYPVNGYVIEVGDSVEEMAAAVGQACAALQRRDVPHNLLITDSGSRVFLWPQCYAEKQAQGVVPEDVLATGVNPAVFEIAGHLVLKRKEDYEAMTQDFAWRMLAEVSLPEERFAELAHVCFG